MGRIQGLLSQGWGIPRKACFFFFLRSGREATKAILTECLLGVRHWVGSGDTEMTQATLILSLLQGSSAVDWKFVTASVSLGAEKLLCTWSWEGGRNRCWEESVRFPSLLHGDMETPPPLSTCSGPWNLSSFQLHMS